MPATLASKLFTAPPKTGHSLIAVRHSRLLVEAVDLRR
jgi:hypothetical protein